MTSPKQQPDLPEIAPDRVELPTVTPKSVIKTVSFYQPPNAPKVSSWKVYLTGTAEVKIMGVESAQEAVEAAQNLSEILHWEVTEGGATEIPETGGSDEISD